MYLAGIDIGSTTTKVVILDERKQILSKEISLTSSNPAKTAKFVLKEALKKLRIKDVDIITTTGYGRYSLSFSDQSITEITCQAIGIFSLQNRVKMIIDIGGQDSKVIKLDEFGNIIGFNMNDKCAAGTGRFLDMITRVLDINIEKLAKLALKSKSPAHISSVCAVFAESEVISLISSGAKKSDIAAGIHGAIANRISGLAKPLGITKDIVFTGGVAKNRAMKFFLEKTLEINIELPKIDPQFTGAYGAAIAGFSRLKNDI